MLASIVKRKSLLFGLVILSNLTSASLTTFACSPVFFEQPVLATTLDSMDRLPADSAIIFEDKSIATELEVSVTIDGSDVDFTYELIKSSYNSFHLVKLTTTPSTGSSLVITLVGASEEGQDVQYEYQIGETISSPAANFTAVNFDRIKRNNQFVTDCGIGTLEQRFFISGENLQQDWLYAAVVIGNERRNVSLQGSPDESHVVAVSDLLELVVDHQIPLDGSIAEEQSGVTLYDRFGRSASIRTIGGCRQLEMLEPQEGSMENTYRLIDENEDGCGLNAGEYLLSADPIGPNEGGSDGMDPNDAGEMGGQSSGMTENVATEEESCAQLKPNQLGFMALLLMFVITRLSGRKVKKRAT